MICTRCEGTGFLNWPDDKRFDNLDVYEIREWMLAYPDDFEDFCICDCCGDGEGWYGDPGEHYSWKDPIGAAYGYNGGLCECH